MKMEHKYIRLSLRPETVLKAMKRPAWKEKL